MSDQRPEGEGVQDLIRRLQEEGSEAGREEARRLVEEARGEAQRIISDAREEADRIRREARDEAERERRAGDEALAQAYRDTVLCVKEALDDEFRHHLRKLIGRELADPETLRRIVVAVAGRSVPETLQDHEMSIELPRQALSLEDLKQAPGHGEDTLGTLARDVAAELLGEGLDVERACGDYIGLRIRFEGEDVAIDLTDEAVTEVLYRHLIPRFRAILEGIVR